VERDRSGLLRAAHALEALAPLAVGSRPARNALTVARLVVDAAQARHESRGAHHRLDFPDRDDRAASRRLVRPRPTPTVTWRALEVAA
jgi:L-aspartate oxidase